MNRIPVRTWVRRLPNGFLAFVMVCICVFTLARPAHAQRIDVTNSTDAAPEDTLGDDEIQPSYPSGDDPFAGADSPPASDRSERESSTPAPATGRKAAEKYMGVRGGNRRSPSSTSGGTSAPHYLALHLGTFVTDDAYRWGPEDKVNDIGSWMAGVSYRVGEWVNSMDLLFRIDVSSFNLPAGDALKFSVLPVILFPDASSQFPLYFGGAIGPAILGKQITDESALALEYQLLMGVRFFEVVESTGFFLEAGVKNHLHLLSDGQFNGTFIAAGSVFTF